VVLDIWFMTSPTRRNEVLIIFYTYFYRLSMCSGQESANFLNREK